MDIFKLISYAGFKLLTNHIFHNDRAPLPPVLDEDVEIVWTNDNSTSK